jgi:hypothetical protein
MTRRSFFAGAIALLAPSRRLPMPTVVFTDDVVAASDDFRRLLSDIEKHGIPVTSGFDGYVSSPTPCLREGAEP